MKIDISDIVKIDGASLNVDVNETIDGLEDAANDFQFDSPVKFSGSITNIAGHMELKGRLQLDYTIECYRCLKNIKGRLDLSFREDFVRAEDTSDIEAYTYEGNYITIDKVLKDNIILNLPMKQVCETECKGFCSKCGTNLDEKNCDCIEDDIDPRMEALKNFFNN